MELIVHTNRAVDIRTADSRQFVFAPLAKLVATRMATVFIYLSTTRVLNAGC